MTAHAVTFCYEPVIPAVRSVLLSDQRASTSIPTWRSWLSQAAELTRDPAKAGLQVLEAVDGSRREALLRVGDVAVETPTSRHGRDARPAGLLPTSVDAVAAATWSFRNQRRSGAVR